jgi:hypothetical protein
MALGALSRRGAVPNGLFVCYHEPLLTPPSSVYAPPLVSIPKQLSFRSKLLLNQERADTREKQQ